MRMTLIAASIICTLPPSAQLVLPCITTTEQTSPPPSPLPLTPSPHRYNHSNAAIAPIASPTSSRTSPLSPALPSGATTTNNENINENDNNTLTDHYTTSKRYLPQWMRLPRDISSSVHPSLPAGDRPKTS